MIEHYWKWDFSQHYWSIRQVGVVAALCYSGIFTTNILYCIYTTHYTCPIDNHTFHFIRPSLGHCYLLYTCPRGFDLDAILLCCNASFFWFVIKMQFPSLQCGMMYSKSEIVSKYDGGDELAALQQVDILNRSAWGPGQHIDIIAVLQFAIVAVCELFCCGASARWKEWLCDGWSPAADPARYRQWIKPIQSESW